MVAINANNLSIGYDTPLYRGLNLNLNEGELVCLLGLNGAGKSTLLKTLCGFVRPLEGRLEIMGREMGRLSPEHFSRVMGIVLTEKVCPGGVTVRELVSTGRLPYTGFFGRLTGKDREIVDTALTLTGIMALEGKQLAELSDGERQKAFIAKALAQECPVIILDEPTAFLDITSRAEMMLLLRRLADEQGKSIIVSTHDLDTALRTAHTLWLMRKGGGIVSGTPEKLASDGTIETFFSRGDLKFDPKMFIFASGIN